MTTLLEKATPRPPEGTRLVLTSEGMFEQWAARTNDGYAIRVDWGEPDANGWYEPTFTVDYGDHLSVYFDDVDRLTAIIESRMSQQLAFLRDDGETVDMLGPEQAAHVLAHLYQTGDVVSGLPPRKAVNAYEPLVKALRRLVDEAGNPDYSKAFMAVTKGAVVEARAALATVESPEREGGE